MICSPPPAGSIILLTTSNRRRGGRVPPLHMDEFYRPLEIDVCPDIFIYWRQWIIIGVDYGISEPYARNTVWMYSIIWYAKSKKPRAQYSFIPILNGAGALFYPPSPPMARRGTYVCFCPLPRRWRGIRQKQTLISPCLR